MPAGKSYQELREDLAERQARQTKQWQEERLALLDAYVATAKGADLESACRDLVVAALEARRFARVIEVADRYAKEFASSAGAASVAGSRIIALIEQGRLETAAADWERLADPSRLVTDLGALFDCGMRLGDGYLLAGRPDAAKKQYEEINRRFGQYPNVGQIVSRRLSAVPWIGKEPPALEGNDLAGKPVRLADYVGRVLLIDFWSTSCMPCVREMPNVIRTYEQCRRRGFEVVGVNLDPDVSILNRFLVNNRVPWRQMCDGQSWRGANVMRYGVRAVPTMFLIDRDGKIAFMPFSGDDLNNVLPRLLDAERKGTAAATAPQ